MTDSDTLFDEGIAALEARDLERAARAFEQVLALDPDDTGARYRLANVYRDLARLDDAEREMRVVVAARPGDPKVLSALGVILTESGRPADAVEVYEDAIAADPAYGTAWTNWLNAQQYVPGTTDESLAKNHARWAAVHAPAPAPVVFANTPIPDRQLVVGFVSADLSAHPVGRLTVAMFESLQRYAIRAVVFSNRPAEFEDDISRRIAAATRWSSVFSLSDASLAAFIKTAKVDILIDMSGHTAYNRLKVFAERAAPVQASWLGYPSTTGVPAMDYLLTTQTLAPPGFESFAGERLFHLPATNLTFDPKDAPPVAPRPSAKNGFITFGCFNNPAKISADALDSFARILNRVPNSRLKIHYQALRTPGLQARLRDGLAARGIAAERVSFSSEISRASFLATYGGVDIALDSFPYSGCMTTCEALWMGCPVVTFPGPIMAGRQSANVLRIAGLSELIAPDRAGYEDLAVQLAQDTHKLTLLRTGLRTSVSKSPLCDGMMMARDFAAAMRSMWQTWCETQTPAS